MSSRGTIRRPSASAARRLPFTLPTVGALGVGLGILLVRLSLGAPHPMSREVETPPTDQEVATPTAEDDPDDPPEADLVEAAAPASVDVGGDSPDAGVETPPEPPRPMLSVFPGRLAYTQCVGIERTGTAFPCPRDRELEAAAWRILMTLPECAAPPLEAGAADIRLRFGPSGPPEILVGSVRRQVPIDADALLACTGDRLGELRTSLSSNRLVVSLRLKLQ